MVTHCPNCGEPVVHDDPTDEGPDFIEVLGSESIEILVDGRVVHDCTQFVVAIAG